MHGVSDRLSTLRLGNGDNDNRSAKNLVALVQLLNCGQDLNTGKSHSIITAPEEDAIKFF